MELELGGAGAGVAQSWRHHKEVLVVAQRPVGREGDFSLLAIVIFFSIFYHHAILANNILSLEVNKSRPCEESFTSCQDTSVANLQEVNSYSGEVKCQKFLLL